MSNTLIPFRAKRFANQPFMDQALAAVEAGEVFSCVAGTRHLSSRLLCPWLLTKIEETSFFPHSPETRARMEKVYERTCQSLEKLNKDLASF